MTTALLSLKDVSINIGDKTLVDKLSIDVFPGKTTALVGESGSGKSITAMSILKLLPNIMQVSGEALFDGVDLYSLNDEDLQQYRRKDIAFIFQEPMTALNPLHTVERQISECITNAAFTNDKRARVITLLTQVDLPSTDEKLKAYPHQLSGGQRQRVMIAMALAKEPSLLIADEPTTALDVTIQKGILDLLKQLQQTLGLGLLLITHDIHLVKAYSDSVCVLKDGKEVESQLSCELFKHPKDAYTQSLINDRNLSTPALPSTQLILQARQINSYYPRIRTGLAKPADFHVLKNIDLELHQGEILGIIGESGSGKTTLANVLLKLQAATGEYTLNGQQVISMSDKKFRALRPTIQSVFQDPFASLSPRMTVLDIVSEGLKASNAAKLSQSSILEKVTQTLQDVGLDSSCLHRYPHEFSGGQRQRIAIARTIILKPKCIILDEPTSALDRNVQQQVLELIIHLQQQLGIAFILITHDLQLVKEMTHNVLILKEGEIIERGTTQAVYSAPQHHYTQALLRAYPVNLTENKPLNTEECL